MSRPRQTDPYWDAYARTLDPPAPSRRRNLQAIRSRIARGEARAQPSAPRRAAGIVFVAKSVGLSLGIAAAGLATLKVGSMAWESVTVEPPAETSAPEPVSPPPADPRSPRTPTAIVAPPPVEEPATTLSPEPTPVKPKAQRREIASDQLREEIELVEQARRALADGAWARLLALTKRHAANFPEGAMAPEREAWRAIARCELGRRGATESARELLGRRATVPQAAMIRRACGLQQRVTESEPPSD